MSIRGVRPPSPPPIGDDPGHMTDGALLGIVQSLQHLHDELEAYQPPSVIHPDIESQKPRSPFIFRFLWPSKNAERRGWILDHLPMGLYMYGDVGSGKTMLMDMFFETVPANITAKTRVHFHQFMQDVHRRMHAKKMQRGLDFDALPSVAADLAAKGSLLCLDEFQCTDVADAMILRRHVRPTASLLPAAAPSASHIRNV